MRLAEGSTRGLRDVEQFLASLRQPLADRDAPPGFLGGVADVFVTRAPGRLDVMGGIADYSGSLVLEMPTQEAAIVALQRTTDRRLRVFSRHADANGRDAAFETQLDALAQPGRPIDYASACEQFWRDPRQHWAAYAAGAFLVLARERGAVFAEGADILIDSAVPEGKGVSSSAAIEVAVMQAVCAAWQLRVEPVELARLCQIAENCVVGAPCGVMDQTTSACGESGRLMAILCQPAQFVGFVDLPPGVGVWGLDSGVRHAVTGSSYSAVRVGAFMGYRILAELAGLNVRGGCIGEPLRVEDPRWSGYLANVTPGAWEQHFASVVPETLGGADFLGRYGGITDPVTRVAPEATYRVRAATAHPVYEHFRVQVFRSLLRQGDADGLELAGELMYQSHASYSACGLGCSGTDALVEQVRAAGPSRGLFGAKMTGGGSGGTVAVLGRSDTGAVIDAIAEAYRQRTGYRPRVFSGSSPGAAAFGWLRLCTT